jgi:hypothetical protein
MEKWKSLGCRERWSSRLLSSSRDVFALGYARRE